MGLHWQTRREPETDDKSITIRIARDLHDLSLVTAVRPAVISPSRIARTRRSSTATTLVAAHFIGFVGKEPVACLRVRFFGDFAKVERLAVRRQYRRSRVAFKLVRASVEFVKRKGFRRIYGQAQDRLVEFLGAFRRQAARP